MRRETEALKSAEKTFQTDDSMEALAALEAAEKVHLSALLVERNKIAALNATEEEMLDAQINATQTDGTVDDELYFLEMVAATIECARAGI
jgi:hypothetical protein